MPKKAATSHAKKAVAKKASDFSASKPVCKESGCMDVPQIKGFCRLHFLKVLAGKAQGSGRPSAKLHAVKDRRRAGRMSTLEPAQTDDAPIADKARSMGELDLDIDDTGLEITGLPSSADFGFDDTGT
jgi:hypothetical protein